MFCIIFCVQNATFIYVSLKSFVIFLVSLLLYVKVAHLVFWCCGSAYLLCFHCLGCPMPKFTLIHCCVAVMKPLCRLIPFPLLPLLLGMFALCSLDSWYCMFIWVAGVIWYYICVCFIYIVNSRFVFLWCIVRSRKSVELCSLQ